MTRDLADISIVLLGGRHNPSEISGRGTFANKFPTSASRALKSGSVNRVHSLAFEAGRFVTTKPVALLLNTTLLSSQSYSLCVKKQKRLNSTRSDVSLSRSWLNAAGLFEASQELALASICFLQVVLVL